MNVFIFKFLFIYSCVGSLLQRMGSSLLLRLTPVVVNKGCSLVVVCGLLVAVASPVVGLVVVAHRLSCPLTYGIFMDLGSNPCPLH